MAKFKVGDKIKVVRNRNSNSYGIGKIYTIIRVIDNNGGIPNYVAKDNKTNFIGNNLLETDIEKYTINIKDIEKENKKITDDIEFIKLKIKYLKEKNKKEFSNTEFLSWYIVNITQSNDKDKEVKLSKILNSLTNNININILKAF